MRQQKRNRRETGNRRRQALSSAHIAQAREQEKTKVLLCRQQRVSERELEKTLQEQGKESFGAVGFAKQQLDGPKQRPSPEKG